MAVAHGHADGDTVVVHVRVPGVLVPVPNPDPDCETVGVYVGVPGVLVPVDWNVIVLESVKILDREELTDIDTLTVTVYVADPGVNVLVFTEVKETDGDPLVEFILVGVGGSTTGAVIDGV